MPSGGAAQTTDATNKTNNSAEHCGKVTICYPKQRLGAVTRLKNNIQELLPNFSANGDEIKSLMKKLDIKIEVFMDLCEEELSKSVDNEEESLFVKWRDENYEDMMKFQHNVNNKIATYDLLLRPTQRSDVPAIQQDDGIGLGESASAAGSKASSFGSQISACRWKLTERKAKIEAEKKFKKKAYQLEQAQLKLKHEMEEMKLLQEEEEQDHLEKALQVMDCGGKSRDESVSTSVGSSSSLSTVLDKQNEVISSLIKTQQQSLLPSRKPDIFTGDDVTTYLSFKLAFEQIVSKNCSDDSSRYYYLDQFTDGYAKKLVRSCNCGDPSVAYAKAIKMLDAKYGNSYVQSQAYLKKLENWPRISYNDGKGFEELSLYLSSCLNMMGSLSELNQLNSHREIKMIIEKLPFDVMKAWRVHACSLLDNEEQIKFQHLEKFIARQSRIYNQPIFGDISSKPLINNENNAPSRVRSKKVLATSATDSSPDSLNSGILQCPCCKKIGSHELDQCFFFKKKSLDERKNFVKIHDLCFACLREGHRSSECEDRLSCKICEKLHPSSLHVFSARSMNSNAMSTSIEKDGSESTSDQIDEISATSVFTTKQIECERILSPAVPVIVHNSDTNTTIKTYMALDTWATESFMSLKLMEKLGFHGADKNLTLSTMGAKTHMSVKVIKNVKISAIDGKYSENLKNVHAIKNWPFGPEDSPMISDVNKFEHLKTLPFEFIDAEIGILVGTNVPMVLKPLEVISGKSGEPYVVRHSLGYAIYGPSSKINQNNLHSMCHRISAEKCRDIETNFAKMYAEDFVDANSGELAASHEDKMWMENVKSSIKKLPSGHYEVGLPFRDGDVVLPNNYHQALSRLNGLKKRFNSNCKLFEDYKTFMDKMLKNGYIERVHPETDMTKPGKVWYLVHHPVYHKVKQKIRVVFDCSLKYAGVSLNDMLLGGPDLINALVGVLLRFRENSVAIMADIESMFMQVKIPTEHADFMRILWYDKNNYNDDPVEFRLTSHTFGAISSPSIANYALKQAACDCEHFVKKESTDTILNSAYVDDIMTSLSSEEEAGIVLHEIRKIAASAGFNLTAVVSNSRHILGSVPIDALAPDLKSLNLFHDKLPTGSVLGLNWNPESDVLQVNITPGNLTSTRRNMLSAICSVYDPLGFLTPVIVPARALFQETCRLKLPWDEEIPEDIKRKWMTWVRCIKDLGNFTIDRCLSGVLDNYDRVELHVFCDGSQIAYAAAGYARFSNGKGQVSCSLIMSKSRQTPIGNKTLKTVPRIELNSAKLAIMLRCTIVRELRLNFDAEYFWSDSTTVLKYIRNDTARFQRFVDNRVSFIRSHSDKEQWRHVPGHLNIADIVTRGMHVSDFLTNREWTRGPTFLYESRDSWPVEKQDSCPLEIESEVIKRSTCVTAVSQDSPINRLLTSTSDWRKLLARVAVFIHLKNCLKKKTNSLLLFSRGDLDQAEMCIWKYVQAEFYSESLALISGKCSLKRSDSLLKLHPIIDNHGILRVGGRLSRSSETYESKHPIVLPGKSKVVEIMCRHKHVKIGHMGKNFLLSSLREKYWIVGGGVLSKIISKNCIICRKLHGKQSYTVMSELPVERITPENPPFHTTGIDYFGPLFVSQGRGRSREKRYGVVFTCFASRAIHLEVSFSLETDAFLNALRRFTARRGCVKNFVSDNGTNLVGGFRELKRSIEAWNKDSLNKYMQQEQINWKFNPPSASHFGGVWEREIRSVRKILYSLMSDKHLSLTDELLSTFFCEAESILNNRPLTPLSDDPNDLIPLTPNDLLLLKPGNYLPPGMFSSQDIYQRRRFKQMQHLADVFWHRWKKEYLSSLQLRRKWNKEADVFKMDDLVLISDVILPRNQWCVGRITTLIESLDKRVRSAKIKIVKCVDGKPANVSVTEIERPIVKLVKLT